MAAGSRRDGFMPQAAAVPGSRCGFQAVNVLAQGNLMKGDWLMITEEYLRSRKRTEREDGWIA